MASKSKRTNSVRERNFSRVFLYWAFAIFMLKLLIISDIEDGAWYGADGENYIKGVNALFNEGIFSAERELTYWPAGYPIFIYSLKIFGSDWLLATLSILQSAVFSFSTFYFAKSLLVTRIKRFAYLIFLIVLLNPTLSLSSMSVGYESLAASGYLVSLGMVIVNLQSKNNREIKRFLLYISLIIGFMGFIQPRLIPGGLLLILVWLYNSKSRMSFSVYFLVSVLIVSVLPTALFIRNDRAVGIKSISTNLGTTMNIGAGDGATGGYDSKVSGVKCDLKHSNEVKADQERIQCILKWYVDNPSHSLKLFWNKSVYFWSPWFGPMGNGTMARNPWLKISPVKNIFDSSTNGQRLILGDIGLFISWIWLLGGVLIAIYGFIILWRSRALERVIGLIAVIVISSNWLITLISIGDHRFRVPIMGMSLFLQAVGIRTLFKGGKPPMVDGPALR
jgi:hypothetical protein